jgi:NTP pyrophosphatase (non-canonical NTP hydrolase)
VLLLSEGKRKGKETMSSFPDKDKNIVILMEELAELQQGLAKIYRFGPPGKLEHLTQEMGDVLACIEIVREDYNISMIDVSGAMSKKLSKLEKWYD